ncbi:hypothetical protein FA95DRAFT_1467649, partial [Auriscalpium vulgare]
LSSRQTRWMEYLSRFNYEIVYMKGDSNKVTDCLSRYYEGDDGDEDVPVHEYVNADARLDPESEDLPHMRVLELHAIDAQSAQVLKEAVEPRRQESDKLNSGMDDDRISVSATAGSELSLATSVNTEDHAPVIIAQNAELFEAVKQAYAKDATFGKVVENIDAYPAFDMTDGMVTT